jgi:hypothetical protein
MSARRRPSIIGEASGPVKPEEDAGGLVRAAEGLFASRVYRCFLRFPEARLIAPHIPRIARSLRADEDCVWELFVLYVRGADEPWRA